MQPAAGAEQAPRGSGACRQAHGAAPAAAGCARRPWRKRLPTAAVRSASSHGSALPAQGAGLRHLPGRPAVAAGRQRAGRAGQLRAQARRRRTWRRTATAASAPALACAPRVGPCTRRNASPDTLPPALRFCYPCISKWAEIENSCPFCKSRFGQLRRKRLPPAQALLGVDAAGELPGTYLDCTAVQERNQVGPGAPRGGVVGGCVAARQPPMCACSWGVHRGCRTAMPP